MKRSFKIPKREQYGYERAKMETKGEVTDDAKDWFDPDEDEYD